LQVAWRVVMLELIIHHHPFPHADRIMCAPQSRRRGPWQAPAPPFMTGSRHPSSRADRS